MRFLNLDFSQAIKQQSENNFFLDESSTFGPIFDIFVNLFYFVPRYILDILILHLQCFVAGKEGAGTAAMIGLGAMVGIRGIKSLPGVKSNPRQGGDCKKRAPVSQKANNLVKFYSIHKYARQPGLKSIQLLTVFTHCIYLFSQKSLITSSDSRYFQKVNHQFICK